MVHRSWARGHSIVKHREINPLHRQWLQLIRQQTNVVTLLSSKDQQLTFAFIILIEEPLNKVDLDDNECLPISTCNLEEGSVNIQMIDSRNWLEVQSLLGKKSINTSSQSMTRELLIMLQSSMYEKKIDAVSRIKEKRKSTLVKSTSVSYTRVNEQSVRERERERETKRKKEVAVNIECSLE